MQTRTITLEPTWSAKFLNARTIMRCFLAGQTWRKGEEMQIFMARGSIGYVASCMPLLVKQDVIVLLQDLLGLVLDAWCCDEKALRGMVELMGTKNETQYSHGVACAMSIYAQLVLEKDLQCEAEVIALVRKLGADLEARETSLLDFVMQKANTYFS